MSKVRIAIAGDIHDCWSETDCELLEKLRPDGVLFVGDLSEGDLSVVQSISNLSLPIAVILGNHDRGKFNKGGFLRSQLSILGEKHVGWSLKDWVVPPLCVVGGRPCSSGGGFFLSREVFEVFGDVSLDESARRIVSCSLEADPSKPLILLSHSGPSGLGSSASSLCGRDWKTPSIDWGDNDLALAISQIQKFRTPELVVFGHMHHQLKTNYANRSTFHLDSCGTAYLNTACVPRRFTNDSGINICHFSWVEFDNMKLKSVCHRWFTDNGEIAYEQILLDR